MIEFYSVKQSKAIDALAMNEHAIPGLLLMKRAGLFTYETLLNHYPKTKKLLILCGTGNNGGDGFVVAQLAMMAGIQTDVFLYGQISHIKNDALLAYQEFVQMGGEIIHLNPDELHKYDVIIDALFGIGMDKKRPIKSKLADWIDLINQQACPVIAVDIPSGLDANTGQIHGCAIKAERTCTFITHKPGLYQFNGQDTAGKIHYSALFLNDDILHSHPSIAHNHPLKHWLQQLPNRSSISHKGSTGQIGLVGGDQHMMGAVQMAGLAALKVGAGLVKVITHPEHGIALTQALPELMCYSPAELQAQLKQVDVIGIGPGLGLNEWGKNLFHQSMQLPQPKVVDADALTLLATNPETHSNWILTPHPGEAARLLNTTTDTVQNNRIKAIKAIQKKYGGVVVLKGNATLVYDGERLEMCLAGNPGMATGGMGDVLTGAISGLIAQGIPLFEAACLGVSLHAHAGDIIAQQKGQLGLLPTELAATLSQLLTYANR
ncbi:MAG: NAD(P)H-hydrate dehydratase [Thiotrichales bacterium]|nr:NAD(P)H-hydrate dehydratase [Thiotrichales bacterium]